MSNETKRRETDPGGCLGISLILGAVVLILLLVIFSIVPKYFDDPRVHTTVPPQVYPTVPPGAEAAFVFSFVKTQICDGDPYSRLRASFQVTNTGTYTFRSVMVSMVDLDTGQNLFGGAPPGSPGSGFSIGPDICTAKQLPELGPGAIGYLQTYFYDDVHGRRVRVVFTLDGNGLASQSTLDFVIP